MGDSTLIAPGATASRTMAKALSFRLGLRHLADLQSLVFLAVQTVLMVILWLGFWRNFFVWYGLAWLVVCSANVKHNHMHRRMARWAWANFVLDHWLGFLTGTTATSILTEHNLRHHGHNNTEEDFVRASLVGFRSQALNVICFVPRAWSELYLRKPLDLKLWWQTHRPLFWRGLFEQLTLGSMVCLLLILDWRATLLYVLIPWVHGQWWLITFNLLQHQALAPDDPWQNSRNVVGRGFNFFFFNIGYHTAHHLRPTLHWSELPRFHAAKIAGRIDPRLVSISLWGFYRDWWTRRSLPDNASSA